MFQLKTILLIAFGGGLGSVCRFLLSIYITSKSSLNFPLSTLIVNCLGCLAIGIIVGFFNKNNWFENTYYIFLVTGFCGGFTTFSTFGLDNLKLLQNGHIATAITYSFLSILLGTILVYLGYRLIK